MKNACILLLSLLIFTPTTRAEIQRLTAPPENVRFERDIVYGTTGEQKLLLNISRPKDSGGPLPCVIVIHGGGWAGGHRRQHDDLTWRFAQRGYVSATISYRLAPRFRFPAQVEDAKCAVRFLRAHADKYGIDPNRIGAVGFSAGAHLSMMLGTMDDGDGLEGDGGWSDQPSKVNAVVSFFGPTDLPAIDVNGISPILRNFLGAGRLEEPILYQRASPITYVTPGDAPTLIYQGTRDPLVPHQQAYLMVDALTNAGVDGRVELLLGAGHGWGGKLLEHTLEGTFAFFDAQLK